MLVSKPGHYTAEDYWNLPDDQRAELIDGQLYAITPPSRVHQDIVAGLTWVFGNHIVASGGGCRVYPAPFAVNLDADDSTWVEPDISIVCDRAKLSNRGCEGAPNLIVEIASPSSQRNDYLIKAFRYEQAGVREYWIVDPKTRQTTTYRFESGDACPVAYPFTAAVPVGIWGGACVVTVAELL